VRERSAQASARKRAQAEARNVRYRRTRELRDALARVEREIGDAQQELREVTDSLADASVYADGSRVRTLIERHNAALDCSQSLTTERERLQSELATADSEALAPTR